MQKRADEFARGLFADDDGGGDAETNASIVSETRELIAVTPAPTTSPAELAVSASSSGSSSYAMPTGEGAPTSAMRDAVERIVHPPQRADFNSAAQRAEMHDRLTKQAFAANAAGDTAEAASLFAQASGLDPRPTTILSHVNMRLKLGECELAAACYERLLAGETLSETAWYMAAVAIAEQRSRDLAAAALGLAGRRAAAGEHALSLTARQPPLLPPPPQPASPSLVPLGRSDPLEQIGKLKGLLDAGAVTEDEFEQKKAELLERLISK